jgi:hypothetical protein
VGNYPVGVQIQGGLPEVLRGSPSLFDWSSFIFLIPYICFLNKIPENPGAPGFREKEEAEHKAIPQA